MPRNRPDQPKEAKREEILAAASLLFASSGYEGASMPKIAAAVGTTPNTLYWYFGDKDQLFVAVADRFVDRLLMHHHVVSERPMNEQFLWLIDSLRPVRHLVAAVHARVDKSPQVARWHDDFHARMEALFTDQFVGQRSAPKLEAEVAVVTFAIEGAILHDLGGHAEIKLCESLASRLTAL